MCPANLHTEIKLSTLHKRSYHLFPHKKKQQQFESFQSNECNHWKLKTHMTVCWWLITLLFSETMSDLWDPSFTRWVRQLLAIDKETRICLLWCFLSYCHRVRKVSQPTVNGAASERVDRWHHRLLSGIGFCMYTKTPGMKTIIIPSPTRTAGDFKWYGHFFQIFTTPDVLLFGFIRRLIKHNLLYYVR